MSIGGNIRQIRKDKKLTQKELGEKLEGISQQQIGQWENGNKIPKLETIRKIADALDVHLSDLIDDWNNLSKDEILSDLGENTAHELSMKMFEKLQSIEGENGMLDEDLFEKEFDSIMEITLKAGSANEALLNAKIKQCMDIMLTLILKLSDTGRKEALKRVSELTKLSEYRGLDLNILFNPDESPKD